MRKSILIIGLVGLSFMMTAATNGPGTTAANYLKIGLGAKATALGESFTAAADDTSAVYWNTAGLSSVKKSRVDFMQLNWLAGISAKTIFGAYPLSDKDTLGAYFMMLDTPQDKVTTYTPDGGSGLAYHETGEKFKNEISVLNLGYSRTISKALDAGLGLKVINEDLAGDQAVGAALDAGIIYKDLIPNLRLGASLQNIGLKTLRSEEEFPLILAAGAEYAMQVWSNRLNLLADVKVPNDNDPRLGVGAEYWLGNIVAGRVGYNTFSQFSLGLGVALANLVADYAYVPMGELGVTHRISVGYIFDTPQKKTKTPKVKKVEVEEVKLNEPEYDPFTFLETQPAAPAEKTSQPPAEKDSADLDDIFAQFAF